VLSQALLWRLVDLGGVDGRPVDLVIATKFPSYVVRHSNKVVWLVHQFRQAYDLDHTRLGQFGERPYDRATRRAVHRLDRQVLGEARRLFAISGNVADRLERFLGMKAEVLLPPPQKLDYRCEEYGDFVLSVGRLDSAKRVDLLLEAVAGEREIKAVVVGDGPDRARLEGLARRHGLDGRVEFTGRLDEAALADLYARCLGVYYAPIDEDFGMVPYEAFMAEKPVVTTVDAGGPTEIVVDRKNGLVCQPSPVAVREALVWLATHRDEAQRWGRYGKSLAEQVTWDVAIGRLLAS
jgi:glycosyltransferase involved in cell wall biosynthesis